MPNRWIVPIIAMALLLLTACRRDSATPMLAAPMARTFAMAAAPGTPDRRIAVSHDFVVELPSAAVEATEQKALSDCLAVGCTILSSRMHQAGTSVADLVAVEKQLAEVQGLIESETAQRDYLRTITDTVKVDVAYNGLVQQAGPFDISPIRLALDDFLRTLIESVGGMILAIATALPWLPLAASAAWILGWAVRRWIKPPS